MSSAAFGKVILFGEHAVLYGEAALAGGLREGITVTARPSSRDRVRVAAWGLDVEEGPVVEAVRLVRRELRVATPVEVVGEARIPARAGFGSSAALLVAVARELGAGPRTETAAQLGEAVFHGRASGLDVAAVARGGFGLFDMQRGWQPVSSAPVRLAVGLSGDPRDTRACVAHVASLDEELRAAVMPRLGDCARRGVDVLRSGDAAALGTLFGEAQRELARLGLSSEKIDELCDLAGGTAKLTGAGRGGAVIAAGDVEAIAARWRAKGFEALVVEVGAR